KEVACELPGSGARFQGWLPPVVTQPTFVIRKQAVAIFALDDYVEKKIMTAHHAEILREAVRARRNVIIAGGSSSGKTTLVNARCCARSARRRIASSCSRTCPSCRSTSTTW